MDKSDNKGSFPRRLAKRVWFLKGIEKKQIAGSSQGSYSLALRSGFFIRRRCRLFLGSEGGSADRIFRVLHGSRPVFECGLGRIDDIRIKGILGRLEFSCLAPGEALPSPFALRILIHDEEQRAVFLQMKSELRPKVPPRR